MQDLMPPVNTPDNLFHDGDESTGVEGTILYAEFMNNEQSAVRDIQQEMKNVLAEAGFTPDPAKHNQLLTAIQEIISAGITTGTEGVVKSVNDIQPDENGNVKLGSAADADIVTSMTDTTAGCVPVVGWMGVGADTVRMTDAEILAKDSVGTRFFKQTNASDSNHFATYGVGAHLLYGDAGDGTAVLTANLFVDSTGNLSVEWLAINKTDGSVVTQRLQKLFGPLNKPTAGDVGALPLTGGTLSGALAVVQDGQSITIRNKTASQALYLIGKDYDGSSIWYVGRGGSNHGIGLYNYKGANGIYINEDGSIAVNLANGKTCTVNGQIVPGNYGNFDQRYDAKYPVLFRVGARVTYNGSDFGGHVPQGAVNINNFTNNDDRINGVQYAYLQYNLNGNWVNFA